MTAALVATSAVVLVVAARSMGRRATLARTAAFCFTAAIFATLLVTVRYTPRFVLVRALKIPPALRVAPEVNRASDTLRLYEDPRYHVETPTNRVIRWRVLLPAIARALGLSGFAYLALAHVASVLVLALVVAVVLRETGDRRVAVCSAVLSATLSWFLVSMGWLGYFDSWCMLALVAASFVRSPLVLAAASLITPWIDERFTLALPLVLAVRWVRAFESGRPARHGVAVDVIVATASSVPYLLARLVSFLGADVESRVYMDSMMSWHRVSAISWEKLLLGFWHGLRGAWGLIFALPFVVPPSARRAPRATVLIVALLLVSGHVFLVYDVSRAMSLALPALVLAIAGIARAGSRSLTTALVLGACIVNLAIPVAHVVTMFDPMPVHSFPVELARCEDLPLFLRADYHVARARALREAGKVAEAREFAEAACALEPGSAEALALRAEIAATVSR